MKEHAFRSGLACKKLLRTVSLLGWKFPGSWSNEQNISGVPRGGARKAARNPPVAMPAASGASPTLLHFTSLEQSPCCHPREPDNKDKHLLTQVISKSSQVHKNQLPAIFTFSRKFLLLFSMFVELLG